MAGDFVILTVCLFTVWIVYRYNIAYNSRKRHRRKVEKYDIREGNFIPYRQFLENWTNGHRPGMKYTDGAGCYVITIFNSPPVNFCYWKNYNDVYVGQSINVHQRVFNHLTGHGNGDVYADVKYGRYVYVRIIRCNKSRLNELEISLIAAHQAQKSYNRTRGGAKIS